MPIDFGQFAYVPILGVRPAEMQALEELPPADKDGMLPLIALQPWLSSMQIDNTIAKVEAAVGHRPVIVDLAEETPLSGRRRPVHDAFDALRDSTRGFRNWYEFVEQHENYIPCVQIADPAQIAAQANRVIALDRGAVIRINEEAFRFSDRIATMFRNVPDHSSLYFILDFQRQNRDLLTRAGQAIGLAQGIRRILPNCFLSVSASTFPESFVGLEHQEIFERRFHDTVVGAIGHEATVYCDRASVRAERQDGGGGAPAPRIDNALPTQWEFFREPDEDDRDEAYQMAADRAINSDGWAELGIWGTELIRRTARGGDNPINSPARSTAARINIHLHQQRVAGGGGALPDAEEPWRD